MKQDKQRGNMPRREFLRLCAVSGLTTVTLVACQPTPSPPQSPSVQKTPTISPSPTAPKPTPSPTPTSPPRTPQANDWSALSRSLNGSLIQPSNSQYQSAYQLFDPRYDSIRPAAITYCTTPQDIQKSISFAQRFNVPLTARSGGHSYAGYSTTKGIVADVSRMNDIRINVSAQTVKVGAGVKLIDLYAALARYNLVLPAGS